VFDEYYPILIVPRHIGMASIRKKSMTTLHNGESHDLCSSLNTIEVILSRRVNWDLIILSLFLDITLLDTCSVGHRRSVAVLN